MDISIKSPVESIDGVWKFTRKAHYSNKSVSLPQHLLHLIESGSYRLKTNGREYNITTGDLIYYYGSEQVEWVDSDSEVVFYSIGFTAPLLQPLPFEYRVFQAGEEPKNIFTEMYKASLMPASAEKSLILFSQLTKLLSQIEQIRSKVQVSPDSENNWWKVETHFYSQRNLRPSIDELCEFASCSRSTIVRLCRKATGVAPLSRFQKIRMAEAKALIINSTLNVTQIAEYLGYPRMHEFSREFSHYFKKSPTHFKKN